MKLIRFFLILFLLLLSPFHGECAGDSVRVSLITIYPGSELYEIYGHTELRVVDGWNDTFYNFGLFDFNAPGFVSRFVAGKTDYLCGGIPAYLALQGYQGRRVVEQVLNLTPREATQVRDLLIENALPENAVYRYKFLSDNCATRPRDIIEKVLGERLRYRNPHAENGTTYREIMRRYNMNYSWERFGIDLALGSSVDTLVSYRQQMFIPMMLMQGFAHARVVTPAGVHPLVKNVRVLEEGSENGLVLPPTPWWATPMTVALVLLAATLIITVIDLKRRRVSRWFDTLIGVCYALAGCLSFFLVFVSVHESTSPNFNVFWLHPFYFIPAVLIWVPRLHRHLLWYHYANLGEMIIFALAIPFLPQVFAGAFYPLMAIPVLRSFNYVRIHAKSAP